MENKTLDKDIAKALIAFGVAAIFAILAITLFVLTPFLPDEALLALGALISGAFGTFKLITRNDGEDSETN